MNNETAVKRMTIETAIRRAQAGEFEFIDDAHLGMQTVRYQTNSGKWSQKILVLE